jgi:dTDP-4-dehydrorhamnose 3,5-epimerase
VIFEELKIDGAYKISPKLLTDDRGSFSRVFCEEAFGRHHLNSHWVQMNVSRTRHKGVARGLHFQNPPYCEVKLVRCVKGRIFDVAADLRAGSPTYGKAVGVELDGEKQEMLYVPAGCAHGFQTLTENVELHYCHSVAYQPDFEAGVVLTDPDLAINWPLPFANVSERDLNLPKLTSIGPIDP